MVSLVPVRAFQCTVDGTHMGSIGVEMGIWVLEGFHKGMLAKELLKSHLTLIALTSLVHTQSLV